MTKDAEMVTLTTTDLSHIIQNKNLVPTSENITLLNRNFNYTYTIFAHLSMISKCWIVFRFG